VFWLVCCVCCVVRNAGRWMLGADVAPQEAVDDSSGHDGSVLGARPSKKYPLDPTSTPFPTPHTCIFVGS
jgi:hypothetical protein